MSDSDYQPHDPNSPQIYDDLSSYGGDPGPAMYQPVDPAPPRLGRHAQPEEPAPYLSTEVGDPLAPAPIFTPTPNPATNPSPRVGEPPRRRGGRSSASSVSSPPAPPGSSSPNQGRGRLLVLLVVALLAVGGFGLVSFLRNRSDSSAPAGSALNGAFPSGIALPSGALLSGGFPSGKLPSVSAAIPGGLPADVPAPAVGTAGSTVTRTALGVKVTTVGYSGVTQAQFQAYADTLRASGWTDSIVTNQYVQSLTNADQSESIIITYLPANGGSMQLACSH